MNSIKQSSSVRDSRTTNLPGPPDDPPKEVWGKKNQDNFCYVFLKDRICDWCRTTLYKFCIQKLHQLGEGKKLAQPKLFMYNTNHKFGHFEGKQSNVEDYPADQVPVVPVLFTVVSWVVDHVLVVVHSCTDEKNITNINIVHSCRDETKSIALLHTRWYFNTCVGSIYESVHPCERYD